MDAQTVSAAPLALGDHSPEAFLDAYWQKKPLVIRDALPGFTSPLAPEELAGLALEPDVESRLVLEEGGTRPWELREGPFAEDDFRTLPETHWTLLVQAVDRLLPERVGRLWERFRFLPRWRTDDIMISYAPDKGSVGPHIDHYDVFLVQGLGRRRWQISSTPVEEEPLVPDVDVRVLQNFVPDEEHVLEPGDLLYLPPRVAHHGIAEGDCMTYSVGLRAPSRAEILLGYAQEQARRCSEADRYGDSDLQPATEHPGKISAEAVARVSRIVCRAAEDENAIARWLGRHMTDAGPAGVQPPAHAPSAEEVAQKIREGAALRSTPDGRLAYLEGEDGGMVLFAGGADYELPGALAFAAPLLADRRAVPAEQLQPHLDADGFLDLAATLIADGVLEVYRPGQA